MKGTTIKDFLAIAKKEWREYEDSIHHEDDSMPFSEWVSENSKAYLKEYGIYYDRSMGEWAYSENNSNWKGDSVCDCCFGRYSWEDTETALCKSCNEEE